MQFCSFTWGKSNCPSQNLTCGCINPSYKQVVYSLLLPNSVSVLTQNMSSRVPKGFFNSPIKFLGNKKQCFCQYVLGTFFQSDSLMHKQKLSRLNIKPRTFQVSLSGYLRYKYLADCCFEKPTPLSPYLARPCPTGCVRPRFTERKAVSLPAGTTWWASEHGKVLGSNWQRWLTKVMWAGGKER